MKKYLLGLFCLSSIASASTPFEDRLKFFHDKDPGLVLQDPELTCRITQLEGEAYLKGLRSVMQSVSSQDRQNDKPYIFEGSVPGLGGVVGGILEIKDMEHFVAIYVKDDVAHVLNASNPENNELSQALKDWLKNFTSVRLSLKGKKANVASSCSIANIQGELMSLQEQMDQSSCSGSVDFSDYAVLKGELPKQHKLKKILSKDALVSVAPMGGEKGLYCVRSVSGKKDTFALLESQYLLVGKERFLTQSLKVDRKKFIGRWTSKKNKLQITSEGSGGLALNGQASNGANAGEIKNQIFSWSQEQKKFVVATKQKPGAITCPGVELFLFKNGIYLSETSQSTPCGGAGVVFEGFYQK